MRITERGIRRIIREELENARALKKPDWNNSRSLSAEERAMFQRAANIFKPAINSYTESILKAEAGPPEKRKEARAANDKKFRDEISKAVSIFADAGYEPPDDLRNLDNSNRSIVQRHDARAAQAVEKAAQAVTRTAQAVTGAAPAKPFMVAIRDEKGNLIRVPEEEALKYFQDQAAASQRKAAELERAYEAQKRKHDDEARQGHAKMMGDLESRMNAQAAEMKSGAERNEIYARILKRLMDEAGKFQAQGDVGAIQGLAKLQQNIHKSVEQKDDAKLREFEKTILAWPR